MPGARRPRRLNGEGTYYHDKARGTYRVMVPTDDPDNPRLTARVKTQAEAVAKLRELQVQAGNGLPVGSSDILADFLDGWLLEKQALVQTGEKDWKTVDNYRWALSKLPPRMLGMALRDLEPGHVKRLLTELAAAGMARTSVIRVKSVLSMALGDALSERAVSWNVAGVARMPATRPPAPGQALTEAQLEAVWVAAEPWPREHAFLVTGWQLGLRPGELLGLGWAEVDFESHLVTVTYKLDRGGKQRGGGAIRRVRGAKAGSERQIVMPEETEAALIRWGAEQVDWAGRAGPAWGNHKEQAVFTSEIGTLVHPSNMDRDLAPLLEAAEVPGRWSMTDLGRRTAATYLRERGYALDDIAEMFGHKGTRMLKGHYVVQLTPRDKHLAAWAARRERQSQ